MPPRIAAEASSSRSVTGSASTIAPPAAAMAGTLSWIVAAEVARSAGEHQLAQTARPTATVPALATLSAPRQITLAPVTIVARRVTEASASNLALTEKTAIPLSPTCVRVAAETTSVEKDGRSCG